MINEGTTYDIIAHDVPRGETLYAAVSALAPHDRDGLKVAFSNPNSVSDIYGLDWLLIRLKISDLDYRFPTLMVADTKKVEEDVGGVDATDAYRCQIITKEVKSGVFRGLNPAEFISIGRCERNV